MTQHKYQPTRQDGLKEYYQEDKANLRNYIKEQEMIQILNKKGIKKLLPVQYETFDLVYKGEDIAAKDRTGSGKTLAFALPIVMRMRHQKLFKRPHKPKFLIVLPTRQLAIQVRDEIQSLRYKDGEDFTIAAVYGGAHMQQQLLIVAKGIDIVVGTPGRLIDFLERRALELSSLQVLCLDEADEMLNIGFKEEIQRIFKYITKVKNDKVQCLMFSATIPDWIWEMSEKYQSRTTKFIDMIKDENVKTSKTVQHYCLEVNMYGKQSYIGALINDFFDSKNGKMLIFCETKKEVQRIGTSGMIPASLEMLHGDFKQYQRQKVFHKFKYGMTQCLIATNVAARGLDFPQIDLIIQMQPPTTTDAYIHRSGRTGRAGKPGTCVILYTSNEEHFIKRIQKQAKIRFNHLDPSRLKPYKKEIPYYSKFSSNDWFNEDPRQGSRGYNKSDSYQNGIKKNYYEQKSSYSKNQDWKLLETNDRYQSGGRGYGQQNSMPKNYYNNNDDYDY